MWYKSEIEEDIPETEPVAILAEGTEKEHVEDSDLTNTEIESNEVNCNSDCEELLEPIKNTPSDILDNEKRYI